MTNPASHRRRTIHTLFGLLAFAVAATILAGCQAGDLRANSFHQASTKREALDVIGEPPVTFRDTAVDISNDNGSVTVLVEGHLTEAEVSVRYRWSRGGEGVNKYDLAAVSTASWDVDAEDRGVLRVTARRLPGLPDGIKTDVIIRVPECDGVRVVNAGGPVELVGVGGAITVENGTMRSPGGRIEVRTNRRLSDPVALVTNNGRISLVMPEGGAADFDLYSANAEALVSSRTGRFNDLRPGKGRFRGVWNNGVNPILARSDDGEVRVLMTDDPEAYSVADGWAELVGR